MPHARTSPACSTCGDGTAAAGDRARQPSGGGRRPGAAVVHPHPGADGRPHRPAPGRSRQSGAGHRYPGAGHRAADRPDLGGVRTAAGRIAAAAAGIGFR
ncbi:hypothetical protein G6F55_014358 [Rhizopus delemar]|nr:hypothetical protein G6F55_014358 [Rhizopus delemar]